MDPVGDTSLASELLVQLGYDVAFRLEPELDLLADLAFRATHDPLTRLPNRTLLLDRLQQALARSSRDGTATAVMFIDLDNFKAVNDTHGHEVGDAVLVDVAGRMAATLRPSDTLARLGGDEFVVVCPDVGGTRYANTICDRLREAVASLTEPATGLSASVGCAVSSDGSTRASDLLAEADHSMYLAKRARGNSAPKTAVTNTVPTQPNHVAPLPRRTPTIVRSPKSGLAAASERTIPMQLVFDPVADLSTGRIVQLDASVVGAAPDDGTDPLLGLIDDGIELALELAEAMGGAAPSVALPVTEPTLDAIVARLQHLVFENAWIPASAVCLDVSEALALTMRRLGLPTLHLLSAAGVPIVIDDYSAPETSPADLLALSARMTRSALMTTTEAFPVAPPPANVDAFRRLLDAAARANTAVVATGMGHERDLERVRLLRCGYGQGPYFGVHLGVAECWTLLSS